MNQHWCCTCPTLVNQDEWQRIQIFFHNIWNFKNTSLPSIRYRFHSIRIHYQTEVCYYIGCTPWRGQLFLLSYPLIIDVLLISDFFFLHIIIIIIIIVINIIIYIFPFWGLENHLQHKDDDCYHFYLFLCI